MKRILGKWQLAILVVAVALGILGFRHLTRLDTVDYVGIINYDMKIDPKTGIPKEISGIAGSAACVSDIEVQRQGSQLLVLITIGICYDGKSGSFKVPLNITDDIKEVRFGKDGHLLWSR